MCWSYGFPMFGGADEKPSSAVDACPIQTPPTSATVACVDCCSSGECGTSRPAWGEV